MFDKLYKYNINFKYIVDVLHQIKDKSIPLYQLHEFFILEIIFKYCFNLDHNIGIFTKKSVNQHIFVKIIKTKNILLKYYDNYDFCSYILDLIKNRNDVIEIINMENKDGDTVITLAEKNECDQQIIKLYAKYNRRRNRE